MGVEEKRAFKRIPVDLFARYKIINEGEPAEEATIVNISGGGVCFYAQSRIYNNTDVRLTIDIDPQEKITLKVTAVWCEEISDTERFKVGVQITETKGPDFEAFFSYYSKLLKSLPDPE